MTIDIPITDANILVVDDNHDNLRLLTSILRERGYTVRPVPDGRLALTSVHTRKPDLILLDIMMPGMDGYHVCEQLKSDEHTRDIPVLFISALNEVLDKVRAFKGGAVDYITKPFQEEEILARVDTHLMLRRLQQSLYRQNVQLQQEIAERKQAQEELQRRDAILEALGATARYFLTVTGAIQHSIPLFLERIGKAAGVSRVALFTVQIGEHGILMAYQQQTWISSGQKPIFTSRMAYSQREFPRWNMKMSQGQSIYGNVRQFPLEEQRILNQEYIRSLIAVPILVEREWWGFLELDVCPTEREWSTVEEELLKTAASMLGAAVEREKVQEALRCSEARFRTVADFTYNWEYWVAPNGNILYVSPSCERITGYPTEAFLANPDLMDSIIHPDDRALAGLDVHRLGQNTQSHETEFRIITRSGEEHWIGHVCQSVFDAEGVWLGRRGSNQVITERVLAQKALQSSEERYRVISELVSDFAYAMRVEVDHTCVLEWITDAFTRTTGYQSADVEGSVGWSWLIHPDDSAIAERRITRLLKGYSDVSEFRILTKQGETRWLREHSQPVWDNTQQRVVRIYGAARDISERRWAEEALIQSHDRMEEQFMQRTVELRKTTDRLQNILEIAGNAMIAVDENHRITLFNPAAELMFGYSVREMMGQPFDMLLMPCSHEAYRQYAHEVEIRKHLPRSGFYDEMVARRRDATTFPAEVSLAYSHLEGEKTFMIIIRDLSEQKQIEEDLIASHNRIHAILESITDTFFALDRSWKFVYLNERAESTLGKSREELLEKNIWEEFPLAVNTVFYKQYHIAMQEQVSLSFEAYYQPIDKWLEARVYPSQKGISIYLRVLPEPRK